jgi:hypothetical protein
MTSGTPNKEMTHREVFFAANGFGPWSCYDCGELVSRGELHVHHVDEDRGNDDPQNLVAMHNGCHMRLTHTGHLLTPEHRAKISSANRGRRWMPEQKAKFSQSLREAYIAGRWHVALHNTPHSEEARRKIGDAQRAYRSRARETEQFLSDIGLGTVSPRKVGVEP